MAVDTECGGCVGLGAHRRWCRESVGFYASIYGPMAEQIEDFGDRVGPNNMKVSNLLWQAAALLREDARARASSHRQLKEGDFGEADDRG